MKNYRIQFWTLLALCLSLWLIPESYIFLFPGLLLIFSEKSYLIDLDDWLKSLAGVILVSFAFWIFSYWLTMFIHIKLTVLFYLCSLIFSTLFTINLRKIQTEKFKMQFNSENGILVVLFLLICALRFVPFFNRITGSVGDMTQHNYMTKIIMLSNGFTSSYEPVMPFQHFGEYPLGFHTLSALISMLGNHSFYKVTNFLTSTVYILLHLSLYAFLRQCFSRILSLSLSMFVLLLCHYPQFLNQWGSTTTALSTTFLIYCFYCFSGLLKNPESFTLLDKIVLGLLLAAGYLTHLIPHFGFILYFSLYLMFERIRIKKSIHFCSKFVIVLFVATLCTTPFIKNFNFSVYQRSKGTITQWHDDSLSNVENVVKIQRPKIIKEAAGIIFILSFIFGPAFLIVATISTVLFWILSRKGKVESFMDSGIWTVLFLFSNLILFTALILAFKHRWSPFSHLLHMERIHYYLILPFSLLIGGVLRLIRDRLKTMYIAILVCGSLVLCGFNFYKNKQRGFESHYLTFKQDRKLLSFLIRDFLGGSYLAYACDRSNASVTEADIKAMDWIRENVAKEAIFLTNYGDGGQLIPAIAERKIMAPPPHGMIPWHSEEFDQWQRKNMPTHIFIGKNINVKYETAYHKDELDGNKKYRRIYEDNGVSVYEIVT